MTINGNFSFYKVLIHLKHDGKLISKFHILLDVSKKYIKLIKHNLKLVMSVNNM